MSKPILSSEIIDYINKSILCWLATSSKENIPNVSPKEIFCSFGTTKIIIALKYILYPKTTEKEQI